MTILHTGPGLARTGRLGDLYRRHRRTLPGRAMNKLFRLDPQWFRPYGHMSAKRLISVYEGARGAGLPVVEMMFHSSELMPGGSPYNADEDAVEGLHAKLETVFDRLHRDGCAGVTLTEFAERYSQAPGAD